MRYSHKLKSIRKRKNANKAALILALLVIVLIFSLGFKELDARAFFTGFAESFVRVSVSYVVALAIAVGLTFFVTSSSWVEEVSVPLLDVLQSFPSFALYPLFVVWFGKSAIVTIFILLFEMIWPILFTLLAAKKQIREDLVEAARIFDAKGWKYLYYVLFPLLLPAIITGSIVAWGEAWEAIIAAEIIVSIPGVGTYLAQAGNANNTPVLIIGIFLLLTLLFIINKLLWLSLLNDSTKYQQE